MKLRVWHMLLALLVASALTWGVIGSGAAVASRLLTGKDIRDGSIRKADLSKHINNQLDRRGMIGPRGVKGTNGPAGPEGPSGTAAIYYAVADYNAGDTNEGAIATVACRQPTDVAIAGGVQTIGTFGGKNAAVGNSFPGRMDWSTNEPREGRLDGWIVQFDARVAPGKVRVWATCLPRAAGETPPDVVYTYQQVS